MDISTVVAIKSSLQFTYSLFVHHFQQSMDQPAMTANPARGQL